MNRYEAQRLFPEFLRKFKYPTQDMIPVTLITGDIEQALAFSIFFWPEFFLYRNGVFITGIFSCMSLDDEKAEIDLRLARGESMETIEKAFNDPELWDFFQYENEETGKHRASEVQLEYLVKKMKEIWSAKLNNLFPEKEFHFLYEPDDWGYLTFYSSDRSMDG